MEVTKENIKKYLLKELDSQSLLEFEKAIENREDIKQFIQKAVIASEVIDDFIEEQKFLQDEKKQKDWNSLQAKLDTPESKIISLKLRKTLSIAASVILLLTFVGVWIFTSNQKSSKNLAENKEVKTNHRDTLKHKKKNINIPKKKDSTQKKKVKKDSRKTLLFNKTDAVVQNLESILPQDELSVAIENIGFASGNAYIDTLKLALDFYNTQNYLGAVQQFEVYQNYLESQNDQDFEANYYLAFAYLQTKSYSKATKILEELYNLEGFLEDKKTWKPQVLYALTNLYILDNQEAKAQKILVEIVDKTYQKKIKDILKNE